MKRVVNNKILNELEINEDINESSLDRDLGVNCAELDATASELYAKQESFSKFTDDELIALAILSQICAENPYGKEYADEVFDEIDSRSSHAEINSKIDEFAKKYCHPLEYVSNEEDKDMTYDTTTPRHWFVVYMQSGIVKHPLMWYETEEEAEAFCNENGWEWEDEVGFEWSLDIDEQDVSEDELMANQLIRDTENDKYSVDYDDGFDDDYGGAENNEYEEGYNYAPASERAQVNAFVDGDHVKMIANKLWSSSADANIGRTGIVVGKTWQGEIPVYQIKADDKIIDKFGYEDSSFLASGDELEMIIDDEVVDNG